MSGSATSQAENGDREQSLERRAHNGACARSQAAERFRGSLSADKKRGNGSGGHQAVVERAQQELEGAALRNARLTDSEHESLRAPCIWQNVATTRGTGHLFQS